MCPHLVLCVLRLRSVHYNVQRALIMKGAFSVLLPVVPTCIVLARADMVKFQVAADAHCYAALVCPPAAVVPLLKRLDS